MLSKGTLAANPRETASARGRRTGAYVSPVRHLLRSLVSGGIILLALPQAGLTSPAGSSSSAAVEELTKLTLEDLMNVEVTSVSKQKQRVADAPAAIYVINQDEIRRSGLTSIAELLRLAPGLDVARFNANTSAISARGHNGLLASKLLVLQDGRTLYTSLFSGVHWCAQDYVLEDIDRIEVIRGAGSTIWGANAVNGVINITTKNARETQGGLLTTTLGSEEQVGAVRYGGKLDERTYYRGYARYRSVDDSALANGDEDHDGWEAERGGFRIDRFATEQDLFTLQGDIYSGRQGLTIGLPVSTPPFSAVVSDTGRNAGGNVLGRWTHTISDKSDFAVQLYYDRFEWQEARYGYEMDTFDLDFQHRFAVGQRNEVIWGAGYRFQSDQCNRTQWSWLDSDSRDTHLVSAFVQDDLTVIPNRLHVFAGSKFEVNSFTGFEIQPSVRTVWTPNEKQSFWGAISRSVRIPSRADQEAVLTELDRVFYARLVWRF
jgi:iron complex outermembrane receptor protein